MPKTLDTQGFSGLRKEAVRSEGRPSCSSVLQALNDRLHLQRASTSVGALFCTASGLFAMPERLPCQRRASGGIIPAKLPLKRPLRSSCSSVRRQPKSRLRRLPPALLAAARRPSANFYCYQKETAFAVSFFFEQLSICSPSCQPIPGHWSWPPIGTLPRNRLALSATSSASPVSSKR